MRNRPKMLIWLPPTGRPSERTLPSSDMSPWERRDSSPSAARSVSRAPRTLPGRAVIARPSPGAWDGGAGRLPRPGRRTRRPWSPRGGGSASRRPARGGRQWPSRSARAQRRCARRAAEPDGHIDEREYRLVAVGDLAGEQDHAGAGAKDRRPRGRQLEDRIPQSPAGDELSYGRALAPGHDQAGYAPEVRGQAGPHALDADLAQDGEGVGEVAPRGLSAE